MSITVNKKGVKFLKKQIGTIKKGKYLKTNSLKYNYNT